MNPDYLWFARATQLLTFFVVGPVTAITTYDEPHHDGPRASIIAVAVVQFLGSLPVLFVCGGTLWAILRNRRMYPGSHEVLPLTFWVFVIVLPVAFALVGIITSVGLLGRWKWARRSTLFLATVPAGTYIALLTVHPPSLFPRNTATGGIFAIGDVYGAVLRYILAALIAVSIWWLVFFTRPSVKARFQFGKGAKP